MVMGKNKRGSGKVKSQNHARAVTRQKSGKANLKSKQ